MIGVGKKKITLRDVRDAHSRIASRVRHTGVAPVTLPSGEDIYLKLENLQITGAFKIRGALNCLMQLAPEQKMSEIVTASSGNHGQGVALAADMLGMRCTIVMPKGAPRTKVEATERRGARVVLYGGIYNESCEYAHRMEEEAGCIYVPAYDDERIIAGQGTIGLEILDDLSDVGQIVVPIGGGGLISGIAVAVKAIDPTIRVIGVEPEQAACMLAAVRAGRLTGIECGGTIADGVVTTTAGELTFEHCRDLVDEIVTVGERDIVRAIRFLHEQARLVAEGAGALATAALMCGKIASCPGRTVAVVSGGNIDAEKMANIIIGAREEDLL